MNLALPGIPAIVIYLLGAGWLIRQLWHDGIRHRNWLLAGLGIAAVLHGLVIGIAHHNAGGFSPSFYNSLSLVAWLVVALGLLVALWRQLDSLGIVVLPVAAITLGLQLAFGADVPVAREFDWQLNVHIAFSVFAFAILSLAAAQAVLLGIQDRALRHHEFTGPVSNLPPLQRMEQLLFQLIGLGFALLTLALITGVLFVDDLMAQHLMHKTVLSICAWVVFGLLLWGRWRFGWRGRTAIRMTMAGIAVLLLAYFGSKLVLELILHRVS